MPSLQDRSVDTIFVTLVTAGPVTRRTLWIDARSPVGTYMPFLSSREHAVSWRCCRQLRPL